MVALSSNIGVGTAGLVVQTIKFSLQALNVVSDGLLLVVGDREVVAESGTRGEALNSGLRVEVGSTAHRGNPRAAGREIRSELGSVQTVVALAGAVGANTSITGRNEVRDTAGTELSEASADTPSVRLRDGLLIVTVRAAEHVGQVVLGKDVVEEGQVGLVGIGGSAKTGLEWRHATSVVGLHWGRVADTEDKLGIKVALHIDTSFLHLCDVVALVVGATVDDFELEVVGSLSSFRTELLQELVGIVTTAGLVQVVVDADAVLVGGLGLVVDSSVESAETIEGGEADVAEARVGDVALAMVVAVLVFARVLPPSLIGHLVQDWAGDLGFDSSLGLEE